MIRDDELKRLVKYAEGMGLKVSFKPYVRYSRISAEWSTDGTNIVVYTHKTDSKQTKILSLIHEIAHHKSCIANERKIDPKIQEALEDEENKKLSRKRIYLYELRDSKLWEQIYKDTNCKFNINKLNIQRELDVWIYWYYYKFNKFPNKITKNKKKKQLHKKYK